MFGTFLLFVLVQCSAAAGNKINDSDYARMPPLFHLDNYEECFDEPDAMYCFGEFLLVSDKPSELLTMIQEYSNDFRHYNHTLIRHGYCMKKTCEFFYNVSESDLDQRLTLEACINETIYKKYKLKTKLTEDFDCFKRHTDQPIDCLDILVLVICIFIIMANIIGSLCDHFLEKAKDQGGLRFLYCFSIFRNWYKFVAPAEKGRDPRLKTLKGIYGIRSLNMFFVVLSHSFSSAVVLSVNPKLIENWFEEKFYVILLNGTLIMQTFFVISSFLLVYNWLIYSENHPPSWSMLPKQIIMRFLRITPSYAVILGLTATWLKKIVSGPLHLKIIDYVARDCRENWWKHLLYINNYTKRSHCMAQTWYLAADTQLYIFGVVIFLICRTNLRRKVVLSFCFVAGIVIIVLRTYYQELNGIMLPSPDEAINLFVNDRTFNNVYATADSNMFSYITGMALGYIIYNWQKTGRDARQLKKYRYLYWPLLPVGLLLSWSGVIFFTDGPPQPMYINLLYAAFQKPVFGVVIAMIVAGLIIQLEGLYRPILEWRPFMYIGRLSFSVYLVHIFILRTEVKSIIATPRITLLKTLVTDLKTATIIYMASLIFCMVVESPFANLTGMIFRKPETETEEQAVKETKKIEDSNGIDMSQTTIDDGTIVVKMGTRM